MIDVVRFWSPWAIAYQGVSIMGLKAKAENPLTEPLMGKFTAFNSEIVTCRVAEAVVTLWMPVITVFSAWAKAPAKPKAATAVAASAALKNLMVSREKVRRGGSGVRGLGVEQ